MRIGPLRHRVEVQVATETRSNMGAVIRTWATIANGELWASVDPLTGREFFEAQRVDSDVSLKLRMRYDDRVTTSHRIRHDGRTLHIVSVLNQKDINRSMLLMCKEDT